MFKSLFAKLNLNTKSMIKYGSIANLTLFSIAILFGVENIMLIFPITLISIALSFENLTVKPLTKIIRLLFSTTIIVTISTIASIFSHIGIIINFIAIFSIAYFLTVRYNPKIYKPFMMIYIFAQASSIHSFNEYFIKILTIFLGVFIAISFSLITSLLFKKNILKDIIYHPFMLLSEQLNNLSKNKFDNTIYLNFSKEMRSLSYTIYKTRYKKFLTTNIGKLYFDMYLILGKLNILLKDYYKNSNNVTLEDRFFFKELKVLLDSFLKSIDNKDSFYLCIQTLNKFIVKYEYKNIYNNILSTLKTLNLTLIKLFNVNFKERNNIYKEWERSDLDKFKTYLKSNFKFGSIRFNFALRISICLTLTLYIGNMYSIYKFIWVSITIMSVMQPYYEETISKGKERLIGNFFGISIIIILLTIFNNNIITIITLIVCLYLTYGFKEYYKLSTFTAICSICVSSLNTNLNVITINRIIFILFGILIVLIANKFLFPYKLEDGIKQLLTKLLNYHYILSKSYMDKNLNITVDIILLSSLTLNKLFIRNIEFKNEEITRLIEYTNKSIILNGYDFLFLK